VIANAMQEKAARDLFQTDWDEDGTVSVHLPIDVGTDLLDRCGYRFDLSRGQSNGQWVSPNGERFWHIEEALTRALASQVMPGARR